MAELLAPAGSLDNVLTAIDAGADAVYFGGKSFNARRFAHNLDDEEIVRAVRTAHLFGVKVYVTVNILMADTELDDLTIYLKSLDKAGVDGIIVQDMAVALLARRVVPDLPLHGSTQMTVADSDGVRFLEENGFTQAVLSRELSLADIQSVCASSPLAIEVFIHGASCMAYSGQCLMSSFLGGRSGNRGACAQPCRQPYTLVRDGKAVMKQEAYVLSLKDLKGLDYIDDLLDAGVTSFKIEGRMKGDTYVRTVVTAYRKVIDAHNSSPKARKEAHDEAAALLTSAFNRSYQDDFLRGMVQRRTLTEKNPSGRQTASDAAVGLTRKIPIYAHVDVDGDGRLELTLWDEKAHTVVVAADFLPQPASKRPATIDYLKKQLGRLGETPFALAEVTAWDETKMIPASVLNDLRRQAADALTEVILADYHRPAAGTVMPISETVVEVKKGEVMELVVRCDTVDGVAAAAEKGADVIIFGGESYHHRPFLQKDWQAAVKAAHDSGAALWAGTPRIVREAHRAAVQGELERAA
ncbi:U32 family peptidase, partial [Megasphaera massiliensis]